MAEPNSLALSPVKIDPKGMKEIEQISRSKDLSTFYHIFIKYVLDTVTVFSNVDVHTNYLGGFPFPRKLIQ